LIGVVLSRQLGIDVEKIRADFATEKIAARFFSANEVRNLVSLSPEKRGAAFFSCWTRKEAYIKGRGEGLSYPLNGFDVSLLPGEPAALLASRTDPAEVSRWSLISLEPAPGYAAAVAVEGRDLELSCWAWLG
jgi:4'-phosphopantetheinyl transferase